jgi:hypothetical protein
MNFWAFAVFTGACINCNMLMKNWKINRRIFRRKFQVWNRMFAAKNKIDKVFRSYLKMLDVFLCASAPLRETKNIPQKRRERAKEKKAFFEKVCNKSTMFRINKYIYCVILNASVKVKICL